MRIIPNPYTDTLNAKTDIWSDNGHSPFAATPPPVFYWPNADNGYYVRLSA